MRKNSIKSIRVNAEVQHELSNIIRNEIKDPRISTMTSVVAVDVTPDLKYAKAYISVLAASINLRNTPQITFVLDQSIEYGVNMSKLIDEVNGKLSENQETKETSEEDNEE